MMKKRKIPLFELDPENESLRVRYPGRDFPQSFSKGIRAASLFCKSSYSICAIPRKYYFPEIVRSRFLRRQLMAYATERLKYRVYSLRV